MYRALRLAAIAAVAMAFPAAAAAPVTGQQAFAAYVIPSQPDPISEASFQFEDTKIVDAFEAVNVYVNVNMQSMSDLEQYGMDDYFVQAPASGKGDCEDYALTKLLIIENSGYDIVGRTKLVFVRVHDGKDIEGHAILAVEMPNGSVGYLDNLNAHVMTRAQLVAQGYEFFDWKA